MQKKIPFNKPFIAGKELSYIADAVASGQLAGDGKYTKLCQNWMQQTFGAQKVLLTHSCTGALEMAAMVAGINPGDEVILPSYTFVSTANAFVLRGANVTFVDIHSDTLNIDESKIEENITTRTKAVVPVHYAGVGCNMDAILKTARKHNLTVIEDAAQGVNAQYNGKYLGTIGDLGCYSFHETKNYISGEGGALIINNARYNELAEIIREKGTNRTKFFRGEIDKYTWIDIGSSYLPSELVAAFLYAQFENAEEINRRRHNVWNTYWHGLETLESQGCILRPTVPAQCSHNAHMFYILLENIDTRDHLIRWLKTERDIHAVFHYLPLHSSPMGRKITKCQPDLPVTDDISSRLVRLPLFYSLEGNEQEYIIDSIISFFK